MRIALVLHQFDPRLGGVEHWTWQFAAGLLSAGHEVHVVAMRFAPEAVKLGIVAHPIPRENLNGSFRIAFAEQAELVLRRLKADVIHDTGAGWHCDVFQPHGGSRTASFEQNLLLLPRWMRAWKRRLAPLLPRHREFARLLHKQYAADGRIVLALSKMVARDLQQHHEVPAEQIRLVYNGVDVERFSPALAAVHREPIRQQLGLRDETTLALIVAHNFALKGVPAAISAVGRLARAGADVHLAVVGGKRFGRCRRLADRCGAGRSVTFLGSAADAAPYFGAADVYVQPTWYDPCSLVVLEGLACGLPVITSRFNGAGELLTGQEGVVLDDPGDDEKLAAALLQYVEPAARRLAGTAARKLAQRHTLERNCQEIITVYEEIARRNRSAAA